MEPDRDADKKERCRLALKIFEQMLERYPIVEPAKHINNRKKRLGLVKKAVVNRRIVLADVRRWDWFNWIYSDNRRRHAWERARIPVDEMEALLILLFDDLRR